VRVSWIRWGLVGGTDRWGFAAAAENPRGPARPAGAVACSAWWIFFFFFEGSAWWIWWRAFDGVGCTCRRACVRSGAGGREVVQASVAFYGLVDQA
jgi:hypothetical protein